MNRRNCDRRSKPRFELVGALHATADALVELPLMNVGSGGCLVVSPIPLVPESVHTAVMRSDEWESAVQVRVRHVRPSRSRKVPGYLIGLEFLSPTPTIGERIHLWLADTGPATDGLGNGGR